jgi:hypothetical protein
MLNYLSFDCVFFQTLWIRIRIQKAVPVSDDQSNMDPDPNPSPKHLQKRCMRKQQY